MNRKILVVDDSEVERMEIEAIIRKAGFLTTQAASGEEAVVLAKKDHPDLIVMDVVMPGMNGYQATRDLSRMAETANIPVLMCTSRGTDTDKAWGMRQGAKEYLVKPVDPVLLVAKIKALLGIK